MEDGNSKTHVNSLSQLVDVIQRTNQFFLNQVQKQVNTSLTLRNWIIGYYIMEYEQGGQDRADYGDQLYSRIADKLKGGWAPSGKGTSTFVKTFISCIPTFCGHRPQNHIYMVFNMVACFRHRLKNLRLAQNRGWKIRQIPTH
jgi:hypothetical protein